jgi:hypothetical protein
MVSDNLPDDDQSADKPSAILIPVQVEHVDQLVQIARDLAGFILILDAAAIGDPALGAVERILSQINDQLQEFKSWFHNAWRVANAGRPQSNE